MKKMQMYKGWVIATDKDSVWYVFTKDEWSYGNGCRYSEWDADRLIECKEFIDSY